jgi:hypothetical protein
MTIDALADLLKSRGCEAVCYFHTDHFEPWSSNIDDASAQAIERMAEMARSSPYARRLSLFYSVFVPYRLEDGSSADGDVRVPDDGIVFSARSARQEDLAREAIRPLVAADGHEMHLHVHHEFWTRNASHFDHPASRWVNACSTPEADGERLDLHFGLCKEAIAREIGRPFERWAFIHGNWALNASDPLVCAVSDEMAMIMRHGGFGDFSFPAGRGHCDPKLETPFTCLPLDLPRAYDDPRADPRPIGLETRVLRPDRFLIWNSPIKSNYSSLDYYSVSNRARFRTPERVVAAWLGKSVCLGQKLFIKTHAHSMKGEYQLTEPGSAIPHTYPDVVAAFECLSRVCDRARIELQFNTVNEVVGLLGKLDGAPKTPERAMGAPASPGLTSIATIARAWVEPAEVATKPAPHSDRSEAATPLVPPHSPAIEPVDLQSMPIARVPSTLSEIDAHSEAALPPITPQEMAVELTVMHREWMMVAAAKNFPVDELYQAKLANGAPLERYEIALAAEIAERYPAHATRVVEIGSGWGGLAILLARLGFETLGFEGNVRRYEACRWHIKEQIRRFPALRNRLLLAPEGLFPEVFSDAAVAKAKINLCVTTNITSTYSAEHQHAIIRAVAEFDEWIIDLARFGQTRDSQSERDALFQTLSSSTFKPIERLFFQAPYEYWRFRSRSILGASRIPPSVVAGEAAAADFG